MWASQYAERMGLQFELEDFEFSQDCYNALKANAEAWTEAEIEANPTGFLTQQFTVIEDYHGVPWIGVVKSFWNWMLTS